MYISDTYSLLFNSSESIHSATNSFVRQDDILYFIDYNIKSYPYIYRYNIKSNVEMSNISFPVLFENARGLCMSYYDVQNILVFGGADDPSFFGFNLTKYTNTNTASTSDTNHSAKSHF